MSLLPNYIFNLNIFINPWSTWFQILGGTILSGFIGYSIITSVITGLYVFSPPTYKWYMIGLFLLYVGPVIFFTPFLLLFIVPNSLKGDWYIPVGCGRDRDGNLKCV